MVKIFFNSRFAFIYHLSKDAPLRRTDTVPSGLGSNVLKSPPVPSAPPQKAMDEPDLTRQASDLKIKSYSK
jgi:hypothetical protein